MKHGILTVTTLFLALFNPWTVARMLSPDGTLTLPNQVLILMFDAMGATAGWILSRPVPRRTTFKRCLILSMGCLIGAMAAVFFEVHLMKRSPEELEGLDRFFPHKKSYAAFSTQYLHPLYFFSTIPLDPEKLEDMNNPVCSVDHSGFRGGGPKNAGGRKLAFLLGGSGAFSYGCSSNDATITGQLNVMQETYYFVNAGVPGWNTTQEFSRLAYELIDLSPSLVVAYDGFNDASHHLQCLGTSMPFGTLDNFGMLADRIEDIRHKPFLQLNTRELRFRLLPRTIEYLDRKFSRHATTDTSPLVHHVLTSEERTHAALTARGYLSMIRLMQDLCTQRGCRFMAVWQPSFFLHDHVSTEGLRAMKYQKNARFAAFLKEVRSSAVASLSPKIYDFGDLFDPYFALVAPGEVFVDYVHLNDRGNQIVAAELIKLLEGQAKP